MDDLLDLNFSAPPPKPAQAQPTNQSQLKPQSKSFDLFAQPPSSSTPTYYSTTPLRATTPVLSPSFDAPSSARLNGLGGRGASNLGSRSGTGLNTPNLGGSGGGPSRSMTPNSSIVPAVGGTGGGGSGGLDAFSGLLSMPSGDGMGKKNLTMAERQAQLAEEKRRKEEAERLQYAGNGAFWDKLGESATSTATAITPYAPDPMNPSTQFDDILKPLSRPVSVSGIKPPPSSTKRESWLKPTVPSSSRLGPNPSENESSEIKPNSAGMFWDQHNDLLSTSSSDTTPVAVISSTSPRLPTLASSSPRPPPAPVDPWDFDALSSSVPTAATLANVSKPDSGKRTPVSKFDFDTDKLDDGDDLLGELGRPAKPRPVVAEKKEGPKSHLKQSRSSSPPPHIVGQIVEMGFPPAQALEALVKTSTGVDVQAAMEFLLQGQASGRNGGSSGQRGGNDFGDEEADIDYNDRERDRREEERSRREKQRRREPETRDGPSGRERDRKERESPRHRLGEQHVKDSDNYMAQASEFQQAVWSKATSLWNSGKQRAIQVYEEQKKAYEEQQNARRKGGGGDAGTSGRRLGGNGNRGDSRPRWMVDAEENGWGRDEGDTEGGSGDGGFRDDDNDNDENGGRRGGQDVQSQTQSQSQFSTKLTSPSRPLASKPRTEENKSHLSVKERADLLFADQPAQQYVSPLRRPKKPTASNEPSSSLVSQSLSSAPPLPAQPLRRTRTLVPASQTQIQTSASHKAEGNEHFKLGRFAEAESSYTLAITALPKGHILLVPLYNNRAATRLKLGQASSAIADCSEVLKLVGEDYHPSKEAALPTDMKEVKLPEGVGKAYVKRAQGWEMAEKWKAALEDWEKVLGLDVVFLGSGAAATTTRSMAAEGVRRAKRMLEGGEPSASNSNPKTSNGTQSRPTSISNPKPIPTLSSKPTDLSKSAAVTELRKAALAAEAEDEQRLAVKDSVDARLNAWRSGKETNLRALIASLDMVLWDDILKGGLKVGMHELVMEKQVKNKYMKVIARLHPDKLDVTNTTVEQRMLANGAFGTLSEAWQAFNNV